MRKASILNGSVQKKSKRPQQKQPQQKQPSQSQHYGVALLLTAAAIVNVDGVRDNSDDSGDESGPDVLHVCVGDECSHCSKWNVSC